MPASEALPSVVLAVKLMLRVASALVPRRTIACDPIIEKVGFSGSLTPSGTKRKFDAANGKIPAELRITVENCTGPNVKVLSPIVHGPRLTRSGKAVWAGQTGSALAMLGLSKMTSKAQTATMYGKNREFLILPSFLLRDPRVCANAKYV